MNERVVLKIGGSLVKHPEELKKLCKEIDKLRIYDQIIIVPGGDGFADLVRNYYRVFNLSEDSAHWMAILAMDQYGFLLSNLIPNSRLVNDLNSIEEILILRFIPIVLSYKILHEHDALPHSWSVTSDSISLYMARLMNADKLILLKDVDGAYIDGALAREITLEWLANNESCIDQYFPILADEHYIETFVLNGLYPKRLSNLLLGRKSVYTRVKRR